jgi:hypothetical protein
VSLKAEWQNPLAATKHKQQTEKFMKSKNMWTLLLLTIMSLIVVLNVPGQTGKSVQPSVQLTKPAPSQPMPVVPAPVQPGQPIQPAQPGQPTTPNQPPAYTNRMPTFTNQMPTFTNRMPTFTNRMPTFTNQLPVH